MRLTGYGFRQEGLPCSRRAYQERSFWNLSTQLGVLLGVLQKVDDFGDFFLGAFEPGDIVERNVGTLAFLKDLRTRLADVENLTAASTAAAQTTHDQYPSRNHDPEYDDPDHQLLAKLIAVAVEVVKVVGLADLIHLHGALRSRHVEVVVWAGTRAHEPLVEFALFFFPALFIEVDLNHATVVDNGFLNEGIGGKHLEISVSDLTAFTALVQHHHANQYCGDDGVDPVEVQGLLRWLVATWAALRALVCVLIRHRCLFQRVLGCILNFLTLGVGPELLETVECSGFAVEHVYHHVRVIQQHPLCLSVPFGLPWALTEVSACAFFYAARNGADLGGRISVANHKEVGNSVRNLA